MNLDRKRASALDEIKQVATQLPGLSYSVVNGGFVYNPQKIGDIDVLTVVEEKDCGLDSLREYIRHNVAIQLKYGFKPEADFPTEIATPAQIQDTLGGRAFTVDSEGRMHLKKYNPNELLTDAESDYRYWLYMLATHDFTLLGGDLNRLKQDTREAILLIFLFTHQVNQYGLNVPLLQVRQQMLASAGLSYILLDSQTQLLCDVLNEKGLARLNKNGKISLSPSRIREQIDQIKDRIQTGFKAQHWMASKDVREITQDLF